MKAIYLMGLVLMAGCASADNRADIVISDSGFMIDGELYTSRSLLAEALIAKGVKRIHFLPQKEVRYQQVAAAVGAAQDAGAYDIGLVGNLQEQ